jgi:transcription-repair coupling factor (superfamily II helicase)
MDRNLDRVRPGRRIVAGAPEGYDAVLLARLAERAGASGHLHIVCDHRRLVRVRRALAFFAPELEVVPLVTWDCQLYDRRSPSPAVSARRIDALLKLGRPANGPRLVLTTTHAFLRRLPPQGMLETSAFHADLGDDIEEPLRHFLLRNGYSPADSVRTPGDFLWDDDRVDVFAPGVVGHLRLDLLNGTLNAVYQSNDAELERLELPPMSEVVLNDAGMMQFQANYQEQFGRPEGHDPLFEAVGQGRRMAGMEHWLPLFYGRTETLCEYLPGCPVSLDEGAETERDDYLDQIADAFQARKAMGSIEEKA